MTSSNPKNATMPTNPSGSMPADRLAWPIRLGSATIWRLSGRRGCGALGVIGALVRACEVAAEE